MTEKKIIEMLKGLRKTKAPQRLRDRIIELQMKILKERGWLAFRSKKKATTN